MESSKSGVIEGRLLFEDQAVRLHIAGGRIEAVEPFRPEAPGQLPWLAPGLVDLQINGYAGIDFNSLPLSKADVHKVTRLLLANGVTTYLPTVITNSADEIETAVRIIAEACAEDPLTNGTVAGIHVEGPFISPENGARGAHDARFVQAPDWSLFERWQKAAGGRIKIITLSPEWPEAASFIKRCADSGVIVSIGHTSATPEQIRTAVAAGARMSTHLGNGAHLQLPRHPNYIWEQLAAEELWTCAIPDGFHLPEAVLKVFKRAKGEQFVLVSDAVYLSGLEPGEYVTHIGGKVVLTEQGKLHTAENPLILAGSAQILPFGIEHMTNSGICPLAEAWTASSVRPAKLLGIAASSGLSAGAPADIAVFDFEAGRIRFRSVYKDGQQVTSASGSV